MPLKLHLLLVNSLQKEIGNYSRYFDICTMAGMGCAAEVSEDEL